MSSFVQHKVTKSPLHGDGVIATTGICNGQVVLTDIPLVKLQTLENRSDVLVCACCFRCIGTLSNQLQLLSKQVSRQNAFDSTLSFDGDILLSPICPCSQSCGELYCSDSCRTKHWANCHNLLCTGAIPEEDSEDHPLVDFKIHAVQTNEIFLMCADIFAKVCNATSPVEMEQCLAPFQTFVRNNWWDAAIAPPGTNPVELRDILQGLVDDSFSKLYCALQLPDRPHLEHILNSEYLSRTIGMFEQNNVGVRYTNPIVEQLVNKLVPGSPAVLPLLAVCRVIVEGLENAICEDEDCEDDSEVESVDEAADIDDAGKMGAVTGEVLEEMNIEDPAVMSECVAEGIESQLSDSADFKELVELLEEHGIDSIFPPLDGTAFFETVCKINHSCVPNVRVNYVCNGNASASSASSSATGLQAQMVALRDILPGEELLQSYIDQNLSFPRRQAALLDYGFACSCAKCIQQQ